MRVRTLYRCCALTALLGLIAAAASSHLSAQTHDVYWVTLKWKAGSEETAQSVVAAREAFTNNFRRAYPNATVIEKEFDPTASHFQDRAAVLDDELLDFEDSDLVFVYLDYYLYRFVTRGIAAEPPSPHTQLHEIFYDGGFRVMNPRLFSVPLYLFHAPGRDPVENEEIEEIALWYIGPGPEDDLPSPGTVNQALGDSIAMSRGETITVRSLIVGDFEMLTEHVRTTDDPSKVNMVGFFGEEPALRLLDFLEVNSKVGVETELLLLPPDNESSGVMLPRGQPLYLLSAYGRSRFYDHHPDVRGEFSASEENPEQLSVVIPRQRNWKEGPDATNTEPHFPVLLSNLEVQPPVCRDAPVGAAASAATGRPADEEATDRAVAADIAETTDAADTLHLQNFSDIYLASIFEIEGQLRRKWSFWNFFRRRDSNEELLRMLNRTYLLNAFFHDPCNNYKRLGLRSPYVSWESLDPRDQEELRKARAEDRVEHLRRILEGFGLGDLTPEEWQTVLDITAGERRRLNRINDERAKFSGDRVRKSYDQALELMNREEYSEAKLWLISAILGDSEPTPPGELQPARATFGFGYDPFVHLAQVFALERIEKNRQQQRRETQ